MSKKRAAILSLYLAGVILLAFTVLPHHHHEDFICFNPVHCQTETKGTPSGHRHDPLGDKSGCIIHKLFQTQVYSAGNRSVGDEEIAGTFPFFSLWGILTETSSFALYEPGFSVFQFSENENIPRLYLINVLPGRAPPIC